MAAWQQNIYHRHAHYTTTSSVNSGQWIETPVATSTAGMSSTRQSQASDLNGESRLRWQHLSQACPMHDNLKHQFWPVNRDSDGNIYRGHIQYTTTSNVSSGWWIESPAATFTADMSNTRQPQASVLAGDSKLLWWGDFLAANDLQWTAVFMQRPRVCIWVIKKKKKKKKKWFIC